MPRTSTRLSKKDIIKRIRDIPKIITSGRPDPKGYRDYFWGVVAHSLFTDLFKAYEIKSEHGVDELGHKWKDVSRKTKAYHRDDRGALKKDLRRRRSDTSTPGLLTPADRDWETSFHLCPSSSTPCSDLI